MGVRKMSEKKKLERIRELVWDIRGDWNDPRDKCEEIVKLIDELLENKNDFD